MLIPRSRGTKRDDDKSNAAPDQTYPLRLVLKIADSDQMISIPVLERLVIGRGGDAQIPDVDLATFNATKCGVSRVHGAFTYQDNTLFIEDLNSTNGTRINGYQIAPSQPVRLRNGDEIELGTLRFNVNIVRAPG